MNTKAIIALGAGAIALAGCQTEWLAEKGASEFGEANRQTYAAMIIDPDPVYEEPLAVSAEKVADAVERYRNDAVKEPESIRSTESIGGDGG